MVHQPIPPIVVNPIGRADASHFAHILPPISEAQSRKPPYMGASAAGIGHEMNPAANQGLNRAPGGNFAPINAPPIPYGLGQYQRPPYPVYSVPGQNTYYAMPQPTVFPYGPQSGDAYAARMLPDHFYGQHAPPQPPQPPAPVSVAPIPVSVAQVPAAAPSEQEEDLLTHYKPTKTKRNLRPKINMIVSDRVARKLARLEVCELSVDEMYTLFRTVLGIDAPRRLLATLECVMADNLERRLFELFVNRLALFIDVFLPLDVFQTIVPELALSDSTGMILGLMFCLSLLIMQRSNPGSIDPLCPLKYYQQTVNSIRSNLSLHDSADVMLPRCLLSTGLLCIYELFFVAMDSTYIKGAVSIFMTILAKIDGRETLLQSSPFYEACFWVVFICDMVLSMKLLMPSMYSLDKMWRVIQPSFFDEWDDIDDSRAKNSASGVVTRQTTIWWQHRILLLYGSINELLRLSDVVTREEYESNLRLVQWQLLNARLDDHERAMPVFLKPLVYQPCSDERAFPLIFFKDEYTAVAAIHFRLSRLALIEALHLNMNIADTRALEVERARHPLYLREKLAKDILGILQTYESNDRIWPVNVHAVRQASNGIPEGTKAHEELKNLARRILQYSYAALHLPFLDDN